MMRRACAPLAALFCVGLPALLMGQAFFGDQRINLAQQPSRTFFVRASGGSDTNCNGLVDVVDPGTGPVGGNNRACAFSTGSALYNVLVAKYDFANTQVTMQIDDGTYNNWQIVFSSGWTGGGSLLIKGNTASPGNVVLNCVSGGFCFSNQTTLPGTLTVQDVQVNVNSAAGGVSNQGVGILNYGNIIFGGSATSSFHLLGIANGATTQGGSQYTIAADALGHLFSNGKGLVFNRGVPVNVVLPRIFHSAVGFSYATGQAYNGSASTMYLGASAPQQKLTGDVVTSTTNISGAANNGGGLIRLTVASSASFTTGDTGTVAGVVSTIPVVNGVWKFTVVDATHIDLQGSAFSGAYTSGGTVSRSQVNNIASTAGLSAGMTVVSTSGGQIDLFFPNSPITTIASIVSGTSIKLSQAGGASSNGRTFAYGYVRQAGTATTANGSANVTAVAISAPTSGASTNTALLMTGMAVTGPGIAAGTTITVTGGATLTLSTNCVNGAGPQGGNCGAASALTFELATGARYHGDAVSVVDAGGAELPPGAPNIGQFFPGTLIPANALASGAQLL